jgi:hypothetical protein
MTAICVAIAPRTSETRILATQGSETILKARLLAMPQHPRALPTLLEAFAMWQGTPVRAALAVDEAAHCPRTLLPELDDFGRTPLYSLDVVSLRRPSRRRDALGGLGDFRDLRQLLLFEIER